MEYFTHTEGGHEHRNEDALAAREHRAGGALVGVLSDGQGGQAGGAEAARCAVETCLHWADRYSIDKLLRGPAWYEIASGVDEAVCENQEAGFATFVGVCVARNRIAGVSCGDSAALLVDGKSCNVLTEGQRKNPPFGSGGASPVMLRRSFEPEPSY